MAMIGLIEGDHARTSRWGEEVGRNYRDANPLKPARGIVLGLIVSVVVWLGIGAALYLALTNSS
jgi:hypothetical protein